MPHGVHVRVLERRLSTRAVAPRPAPGRTGVDRDDHPVERRERLVVEVELSPSRGCPLRVRAGSGSPGGACAPRRSPSPTRARARRRSRSPWRAPSTCSVIATYRGPRALASTISSIECFPSERVVCMCRSARRSDARAAAAARLSRARAISPVRLAQLREGIHAARAPRRCRPPVLTRSPAGRPSVSPYSFRLQPFSIASRRSSIFISLLPVKYSRRAEAGRAAPKPKVHLQAGLEYASLHFVSPRPAPRRRTRAS